MLRFLTLLRGTLFFMTEHETNETQDPGELRAARRAKLKRLQDRGIDPYGHRFDDRAFLGDIRELVDQVCYRLESGEEIKLPDLRAEGFDFRLWKSEQGRGEISGPTVRAAGRIMLSRPTGKLIFVNIKDWTGEIQLFVGKKQVGDENFELAKETGELGELIGVDGMLGCTNTGELTIFASEVHFLCKALEPPPAKHVGMTDPELRQRRRYVDLAYNDGVLERFLNRTRIVDSVRQTLRDERFSEIEGPTLHSIAGGAAARPFITNHNALGIELHLRIALELHLKRLMVGGMERVFELGRVYRNEGISPRHNPEFTMLECYQAYGDYRTMMELTEKIFLNGLDACGGGRERAWGEKTIDFTAPFARRTYAELFTEHAGVDSADAAGVEALAKSLGIETANRHPDVVINEIFEEKVEDNLVGPVFVIDYPASICPLTKRKSDNPQVAERFELFVEGMEIANAYTELNDPDLQEELFRTHLQGLSDEDSMAKMDHDFIRALRHGMPPAGGLGIGIDRMVMLLTESPSIRDVILFPLLRPETQGS